MARTIEIEQVVADPTLNICLDTLKKEKQGLVFCNTKRGAESQAEKIAAKVKQESAALLNLAEKALKTLPSPTKQCKRLALCLKKGIAFHHAGLHSKQRDLVETQFREGTIKIICSTPTLAMGLDMPAFRVVIRDLKRFSGSGGWGMTDIPVLEYHQMCLPGETLIKTSKGELPIKDCEAGMKVLSFDTERKRCSSQRILKTFRRRTRSLIHLTTTFGFSLKLTENHPVYILRKGEFSWQNAKDILPEDKILLSSIPSKEKQQDFSFFDLLPEKNVYVPACGGLIKEVKERKKLSDRLLAAALGIEKKNMWHYKHDKKALPLSRVKVLCELLGVPIKERVRTVKSRFGSRLAVPEIDVDLLWLVGCIATDGTLTSTLDKRTGSRYVKIRLCNMDHRIIKKAKRVLKKLVQREIYQSRREDGLFELEKGCTLLADIFRDHFGIPHNRKSDSVEVPSFLFTAAPDLIGAYLAGVFDGDGSYSERKRILFATGSKKFAFQIQQLLLRIGIIARVDCQKGGKSFFLKGKKEHFPLDSYTIHFTRINYMKRFAELAPVVKAKIATTYKQYNNIHRFHDVKKEFDLLEVEHVKKIPFNGDVFNLEVAKHNNYFANNILVHNCGRAGRPGKEEFGEAVILADSEERREVLTEKYIYGEAEEIFSKLAVEPVLRTYVLSLIASEFVTSVESLYAFFDKTFYAKQYGDLAKLHSMLDAMVARLEEWEFLKAAGNAEEFVSAADVKRGKLEATLVGKRVAELYLDPYTAHFLITCLRRATTKGMHDFAIVHMLSSCLEMRPWLRPKVREVEEIVNETMQYQEQLLAPEPNQFSAEYEEFLMTLKTAIFFKEWIEEVGENILLERMGIAPGEVHGKLERADWLIYATEELARILNFQMLRAPLARMRLRLKHGAKEELLPLLKLKGVGRVRARKLFKARIRGIEEVKKAEVSTLNELIGKALTINIKKQVGIELDPGKIQVKPNKRKGQKSMADFS
jgi:replicative superfamily II helicase/intein/homing endonuclease